jgi:hypothetical protein
VLNCIVQLTAIKENHSFFRDGVCVSEGRALGGGGLLENNG